MLHDAYAAEVIYHDANMLVPWWIMAAYAYDQLSDPILSDDMFDDIASRLGHEWGHITHRHKVLLDREMLKSALAITGRWPLIAKHAAWSLAHAKSSPPGR